MCASWEPTRTIEPLPAAVMAVYAARAIRIVATRFVSTNARTASSDDCRRSSFRQTVPGYATYCAVKGGVVAFARALAIDGGPLGVRVNVVSPGLVQTPMAYVDRPDFDDVADAIAQRHPLRRFGQPEDLAGAAVFLLSDDAGWMTAQTMIIDGGFTAT